MRILQVIPELDTGGAERTVIDVAEAIIAGGGQAHLWTKGGRLCAEFEALGGIVHLGDVATKSPFKIFGSNLAELKSIIKAHKIDLIHAHSRAPAWTCLRAAQETKLPFVTAYHGIYNGFKGLKRLYNSVMARGDLVIANSDFTAAHLKKTHGTNPSIVRVIPCGIDLDVFARDRVSADRIESLRTPWLQHAPKGLPIVMLPGRLTAWKGQMVLIEAAGLLAAQGIDVLTLLVGSDQGRVAYVERLRASIAEKGLENRVLLVGHCDDVPAAMMLADVIACPSTDPEAFGRTAAEAQAMAVPVVASAHGGAMEVVEAGVTGELVPHSNPQALADAIAKLINLSPQARAEMGKAAVARIETIYSKKTLQRDMMAAYAELLGKVTA